METLDLHTPSPSTMEHCGMDVDMDLDLGPIDDSFSQVVSIILSRCDLIRWLISIFNQNDDQNTLTSQHEIDSVDTTTAAAPNKIHIRGVDDLTTNDIKTFSAEHYPHHPPIQVEWIDDTSLNIVFDDSVTAHSALESFTLYSHDSGISALPSLQLREAKTLSTHPESRLQIRTALLTDQKRPRAYEASRFYMMHPEHDPREQRRRGEGKQGYRYGRYRSRRHSNEERRSRHRDREEESSGQDSMDLLLDDQSHDSQQRSQRRGMQHQPDRDRSASPDRQRESDTRPRRRTPPPIYRSRDPHPFPSENSGKELFPSKSSIGNSTADQSKELFSNKMLATGLKKALFPHKGNTANYHRRSDAFDAADETADLFANNLSVRSLKDRLTSGSTTNGDMKTSDPGPKPSTQGNRDGGISILGASGQQDSGFSIRGGAASGGTIKELFPGKALGNEGKELFAEKLKGRGGRRNKAADMFH